MGFKQSKLENGHYLPSTPTIKETLQKQQRIIVETTFGGEEIDEVLDPRSPLACRTPINEICKQSESPKNTYQQFTPVNDKENPMKTMRKNFFSGFTYNVNDPRSPTLYIDRTPLVFESSPNKSLNLNDTFSDLFIETKNSNHSYTPVDVVENDTVACKKAEIENSPFNTIEPLKIESITLPETDPRSPTIGVDRTPIIFFDDDEPNEEEAIENIIKRLSLNMSNESIASITSQKEETNVPQVPKNKAVERVRKSSGYKTKVYQKKSQKRRNKIYEDRENFPVTKSVKSTLKTENKRTPLSCMKNRSHLRSRSVENIDMLKKCQLQFTNLDDNSMILKQVN